MENHPGTGLQALERIDAQAGEKCEKEGEAEGSCYGESQSSKPPLHFLGEEGRGVRNGNMEFNLGKKRMG